MTALPSWCRDVAVLGPDSPLPIDRPFTSHEADECGVGRRLRRRLVAEGYLRPLLRGVFVASHVRDSLRLRTSALRLVVPEHAVVTDRSAAWLHGVDILPRSAVHELPPLQVFSRDSSRVRRPGVSSGIRTLAARDVTIIHELQVTTPLRTACDLGRLLWRYDALAALDGFLRIGVDPEELLVALERFKGYRGIIQLRALAPLADARSESPGESALRLHWVEAGLPRPELQIWVDDAAGLPVFRIDLGDPEVRYGAEYDGEEFHPDEREQHDADRRAWLVEHRGWLIDAFRKDRIYDRHADPGPTLVAGYRRARASLGSRLVTHIDLAR